jgi:hypothetical protein
MALNEGLDVSFDNIYKWKATQGYAGEFITKRKGSKSLSTPHECLLQQTLLIPRVT